MTITRREARRIEADRQELAERIHRLLPHDGVAEPQPGVHLSRFARTPSRATSSWNPASA